MPAAAVIPAPIAYIKVVAVKKLVVGFRTGVTRSAARFVTVWRCLLLKILLCTSLCAASEFKTFTLKKLECSKQAFSRPNT